MRRQRRCAVAAVQQPCQWLLANVVSPVPVHSFCRAYRGTARAKLDQHKLSKASGRDFAYDSPLRFEESVRTRVAAEQQERPSEAVHGRLRFASAQGGQRESHRESAPAWPSSRSSDGSHSSPRHQLANTPLVLPYSELAYRNRLRHARLATLLELADAPYAPAPLRVLLDVLAEVSRLQSTVGASTEAEAGDGLVGTSKRPLTAEGNEAVMKAVDGGPHHDVSALGEAKESLARLTTALSRSQDIRQVLARAVVAAQEAVSAVDVIGDRDSIGEFQALLTEVDHFTKTVFASQQAIPTELARSVEHGADEEGSKTTVPRLGYRLPPATYAEVLRSILALSSALGARVTAVTALDELITLSHEFNAEQGGKQSAEQPPRDAEDREEAEFSLDDVVCLADKVIQEELHPVSAEDHLTAMESCRRQRDFDLAIRLYRRFMQHVQAGSFAVTVDNFSQALVTLAHCSSTSAHFAELQRLLIDSEAAATVPVSVPLYTALIDAVSRATDNPQRMSVALALYRRLRDGQLRPAPDTYAALIACAASTREPTHAFAFYQEARQVCGVASFTPALYTNLLLSYVNAGFGADARRTLDVLVEAGAPLTRAAFHAVLSGAVTLREAEEVLEMMTARYAIQPTPHTYAFLVHAAAKEPQGATTALQLFDLHEEALASLQLTTAAHDTTRLPAGFPSDGHEVAHSSTAQNATMESQLLEHFPWYVRAVEHALMRLSIDPVMDPRLGKYLKPTARIAQQRMNAFTGGMAPQAPTRIPSGVDACIAVLAPDVLANLDEWVEPFVSFYSAMVIPYSALLALQCGGGRRVEGLSARGSQAALHDAVWAEAGDERSAMVEHRRLRLVRFLKKYEDVIHLVSLEEELAWSRDSRRYSISATNWFARSAAFAINLARRDLPSGTKLYAHHENAAIVLVSANFNNCGKYVVDLKRTYGTKGPIRDAGVGAGPSQFGGLREALEKVFYHNPRTQPAWSPPKLSARRAYSQNADTATGEAQRLMKPVADGQRGVGSIVTRSAAATDSEAASTLYRRQLSLQDDTAEGTRSSASSAASGALPTGQPPVEPHGPAALGSDEELDADLLMRMLAADG